MAAAGQRDLDPRQVKAREEFERMREQLTRTLDRTVDPTPWRERARERVAAFEREARRRRPLAAANRSSRWPLWVLIGAAFLLGVVMTAAVAVVTLRGPRAEPEVLIVERPESPQAVAAPSEPALSLATVSFAASEPVQPVAPPGQSTAAEPAALEPEPAALVAPAAEPATPVLRPVVEELETPVAAEPAPVELAATESEVSVVAAPPATTAAIVDPVVRRIARIREIQTLLIGRGHDLGRADGDAGPQTLAAAAEFAGAHGLLDSNLDDAFLAALRAADAGYLVPVAPLAQRDPVLEQINRVRSAQTALNELGYDLGRPDGDAGPMTLEAIAQFAASRALADANLDEAFVALLHEAAAR